MMKNLSRKKMILIVSLCILAIGAAVTLAYLTDRDTVVNTFKPAHVDSLVEEDVADGIKSSVKIRNIGNTYAYIRVSVIADTLNDADEIVSAANVDSSLFTDNEGTIECAENWVKIGDYFYYTKPVAPGKLTGELLIAPIKLAEEHITVAIMSDAIQDRPEDAIYDAWGVKPSVDFN